MIIFINTEWASLFSDWIFSLQNSSFDDVLLVGFLLNVLMMVGSVLLYQILFFIFYKNRNGSQQKIQPSDVWFSLLSLIGNTFIFVVAALLWQRHVWLLQREVNPFVLIVEVVGLILAMDFLMYVFHRIIHYPFLYNRIHRWHHAHQATNALSLFVLHPIESIGFGFLILLPLTLYSLSVYSLTLYLTINLIWGTVGHLNSGVTTLSSVKILGHTNFHHTHHHHPNYNFGFYTQLWDRLFRTHSIQKSY